MVVTNFTQRDAAEAILFIIQAADDRRRHRDQITVIKEANSVIG
jgi:hypothetical protein